MSRRMILIRSSSAILHELPEAVNGDEVRRVFHNDLDERKFFFFLVATGGCDLQG